MQKFLQRNIFPLGVWGLFYGMAVAFVESGWIIASERLWKDPPDVFPLVILAITLYGLSGFLGGIVLQVLLRKPFSKLHLSIGRKGKSVIALSLFVCAMVVLSFRYPFPSLLSLSRDSQETSSAEILPTSVKNIFLIVIDTLRPDHLSAYGYTRSTSPRIDQLAREGSLFSQAICQSTQTGPSHTSLFTSQYPRTHGALFNGSVFNGTVLTLTEILREQGYATTGAFVSGYFVDAKFGLHRGFETYDDEFFPIRGLNHLIGWKVFEKLKILPDTTSERRAEKTNQRVFQWLEKNHGSPFFLWVHYFDPHNPYNPIPPFDQLYDPDYEGRFKEYYNFDSVPDTSGLSQEEIHHIISLYDGEIRYTDEHVGFLLDKLKELNVYDNTLIILTADHGEDLNEHKYFEHSPLVYDTAARIPLILKYPKVIPAGHVVSDQVQSIDIVPTILDILEIPRYSYMQGESLLPLIKGLNHGTSKKAYIETHYPVAPRTKLAIRTEERKIIYTPEGEEIELYDLKQDSYEQNNMIFEKGIQPVVQGLKEELLSTWGTLAAGGTPAETQQELSDEVKEKLKSLGYVK